MRNDQQPTVFHPVGDLFQRLGRSGRVVGSCDRQGRGNDRWQVVAEIHGGDGLAASGVAFGRGVLDHGAAFGVDLGVGGEVVRCEPPFDDRGGDRGGAVRTHCCGAVGPAGCRCQPRARAQQHEPVDTFRVAGRDPHRRHTAQRQPHDVRPLDPHAVQKRDHVVGEIVNQVGAERNW